MVPMAPDIRPAATKRTGVTLSSNWRAVSATATKTMAPTTVPITRAEATATMRTPTAVPGTRDGSDHRRVGDQAVGLLFVQGPQTALDGQHMGNRPERLEAQLFGFSGETHHGVDVTRSHGLLHDLQVEGHFGHLALRSHRAGTLR